MQTGIPVRVFELLISRMCHDIVSPVGAIKSGLELLTEFGEDAGGETMALITTSAEASAAKLRFFRLAYGMTRADVSYDEAHDLARAMVEGPRVKVDWPADRRPPGTVSAGPAIKLLLNMVVLSVEAMPRGGIVEITATQDGPALRNHVFAKADDTRILPELRAAIDGTAPIDELTPRTVQGYYTRSLAMQLGDGLAVEEQDGGIAFAASLPGEAAAAA